MSDKPDFVIWSPEFNESSGGIIALHYLCHLINNLGRKSYIFRPELVYQSLGYQGAFNSVKSEAFSRIYAPVRTSFPSKNSIVIYPEIVEGNPLKGQNIVRWLLYKPGAFTGTIQYGEDDLIFTYQDAFDSNELPQIRGGNLYVLYYLNDIYKQTNFGKREGACFLIKKGAHKLSRKEYGKKTLIDGLNHMEKARIFNQSEVFISYDTSTLYSQYAALCGCSSVVVPDDGVDVDEWHQQDPRWRYGVAYGFSNDEISRAKSTRPLLNSLITKLEESSIESVKRFIDVCDQYFLKS